MESFSGNIRDRFQTILQRFPKTPKIERSMHMKEEPAFGNRDNSAITGDREPKEIEHQTATKSGDQSHQEQLKITQYPACMGLLLILTLEVILIAITESFVILYHSTVFSQCEFSLNTLGLAQADLIYHGIYIISPIYQLFLYLDALRQRNIFQLFTVILFGNVIYVLHEMMYMYTEWTSLFH